MESVSRQSSSLESLSTSETGSLPGTALQNMSPIDDQIDDLEIDEELLCQDLNHEVINSNQHTKMNANTIKSNNENPNLKQTLQHFDKFMSDKSLLDDLVIKDKVQQNRNDKSLRPNFLRNNVTELKSQPIIKTKFAFNHACAKRIEENSKKVHFQPVDSEIFGQSGSTNLLRKEVALSSEFMHQDVFDNSRTASYSGSGTESLFQRFDEIKNLIENDSLESQEKDFSGLSNLLVTKLNTQKQKNKDLEEELALNEASLAKITKELEVAQSRLNRKENHLKEASVQIEKLETEMRINQKNLIEGRDHYKKQCFLFKKISETLNAERSALELEVNDLREKCQNYGALQVQAEEMKRQIVAETKRQNEVIEENKRINESLNSYSDKLSHYEQTVIPELTHQNDVLKKENLESSITIDKLTSEKKEIEADMSILKRRFDIILQKTVEDEAGKKDAEYRKESFDSELSSAKESIHQQYQEKVHKLVEQRTQQLKDQIKQMENELSIKYENKLEQKETEHSHKLEQLQLRHLKDTEDIRQRENKLLLQIKSLAKDNQMLHQQRNAICQTVSSYVPQATYNVPCFQERTDVVRATEARRPNIKSRQFKDPPLITSTSLSNLEDLSSKDRPKDGKEKKLYSRSREKPKSKRRGPSEKRLYNCQEILNSLDSGTDSRYSRQEFYKQSLRNMLNNDSSPKNEVPHHDTSDGEWNSSQRR